MTNSQTKNDIARLSIKELFETKDEYIIPIYQRNYAWTDTEVGQLIDDIHRYTQDTQGQYYLGSLTVKKRTDGCFEVIDGQQRLTTLYLLLSVLKSPFNLKLSFEHRESSSNELSIVKQNGELTDTNSSQIATIYHYLQSNAKKLFGSDNTNQQNFLEKLLTTVQIIRTEIPENTDLNQYFERMNNRGEQLEHHEVIKAKLMSQLRNDKDDQAVFSAIWNACSDMSRYAVSSFSSDERQALFIKDKDKDKDKDHDEYFWLYENFDNIRKNFEKTQKPKTDDDTPKKDVDMSKTLEDILKSSSNIASTKESMDKERFTSIIDFPNFLAQVLYLFLKDNNKTIQDDIHRFDDGNLIEQFECSGLFNNAKDIKAFAVHLLKVRVLFDRHVIKHNGSDDKADWHIYKFSNSNDPNVNVCGKAENKQIKIKMLQTMFHYSFPAKNYKYWLFGYLKWLNDESKSELKNHKETGCAPRLSADKHINFLEKLCDQFYFNRFYNNGHGDEYFDIIYQDSKLKVMQNHDFLHQGTAVANFIFNRLDYILWRKEWRKDKSFKFKFTARNSVEHYYPQNPPNGKAPDNVDHFGNLCLITHSQNSSLSNKMPSEKKAGYDVERYPSLSLKQREMFKYDEKNWNEGSIIEHGKAMIELLNQEISTTQSDA